MNNGLNSTTQKMGAGKSRFLIILMGPGNAGKTTTLKELVILLKAANFIECNNAKGEKSSSRRITLEGSLLNKNDKQKISIGLDGDIVKNIINNFAEFDASQADVCVTAVRLFGTRSEEALKKKLSTCAAQFTQIIYIVKRKDEDSPIIQQQANVKMANYIFEGMKKAMEDGQFSIQGAQAATIITATP